MAIFKKNIESLENELAETKESFLHAQEECEKLTSELEALKGDLKNAQEALATKNGECEALVETNTELTEKVATLEAEKIEVDKEVEAKLTAKMSEMGISDPLEEHNDPEGEPSLLERFIELTGEAKTEFYQKHEAELKQLIR